jgi:DinB family protein
MAFARPTVENGAMTDMDHRALVMRLAAVPEELARNVRDGSPDPPAPGEWTPDDIVRHLLAVEEEVWHRRLAQLASEDHPTWPWTEPDRWAGDPGASIDAILATYASARASTVATLDALDDAGWARTGTHATFGVLDVAGLMTRAIEHDEEHLHSFER